MIRTHGLTHVSLAVDDLERALRFYVEVFGVREYYRDASTVQVLGPGPHDVIALEQQPERVGTPGGIRHFGFRLLDPSDVDDAVAAVEHAGGRVLQRGEHAPGAPYAYVADPDGNEIELWFEEISFLTAGGGTS